MAVDHVQRGLAFGMTVGPGQVALHDQAVAVRRDFQRPGACAAGFSKTFVIRANSAESARAARKL
jgi:hypothetical protein